MMEILVHNVTSGVVVLTTWWLCHSYARRRSYVLAFGFAAIGLSTLATMATRNFELIPVRIIGWQLIVLKVILAFTFTALAVHRQRLDTIIEDLMNDNRGKSQ